jgi:hypothetical protein
MKQLRVLLKNGCFFTLTLLALFLLSSHRSMAQSCPANGTTSINSYPNTYYPGSLTNVSVGSTRITLGAVTYGTVPISTGDIVLIIQMQGAQINSTNSSNYGDGSTGGGYLSNASLLAGTMEYAIAGNSVPLTGGTLQITTGTVHAYQNTPFGTDGQYTYQVIRVPVYYNLKLTGTITAPAWDGVEGGVVILHATNNIKLNGQTVDASGLGFRGGGGRSLRGASGSFSSNDYATASSFNVNGSKGEGIAGTPVYINNNYVSLITGATEGYPGGGSYARGAPGNAGGGGTDGDPANNDQNTGGAGGGNGGMGGNGGWAWSSAIQSGGRPGAVFAQASASRLVMGGGGGAGTINDGTGTPGGGLAASGAAGGGIIIMWSENSVTGSGTLLANGANANNTVLNDGAGGAGAGGSILIYIGNSNTGSITAQANGGAGGINQMGGGVAHGPGGGGGGGIIFSNGALNAASSATGGVAGTTSGQTTNYGAAAGSAGTITANMSQSAMPTFPLQCSVLPVSFLDQTALSANGVVNLRWDVAREVNTVAYIVERSTDGTHFTDIGRTPYKDGDGADNTYEYGDEEASAIGGMIYYRIRETDAGGGFVYSKILSVEVSSPTGKLSVYPNPAQSTVTVTFSSTTAETINLQLFDLKGSRLRTQQYEAHTGMNTVQVDGIGTLPDGIYILQWFDKLRPQQVKILVHH